MGQSLLAEIAVLEDWYYSTEEDKKSQWLYGDLLYKILVEILVIGFHTLDAQPQSTNIARIHQIYLDHFHPTKWSHVPMSTGDRLGEAFHVLNEDHSLRLNPQFFEYSLPFLKLFVMYHAVSFLCSYEWTSWVKYYIHEKRFEPRRHEHPIIAFAEGGPELVEKVYPNPINMDVSGRLKTSSRVSWGASFSTLLTQATFDVVVQHETCLVLLSFGIQKHQPPVYIDVYVSSAMSPSDWAPNIMQGIEPILRVLNQEQVIPFLQKWLNQAPLGFSHVPLEALND